MSNIAQHCSGGVILAPDDIPDIPASAGHLRGIPMMMMLSNSGAAGLDALQRLAYPPPARNTLTAYAAEDTYLDCFVATHFLKSHASRVLDPSHPASFQITQELFPLLCSALLHGLSLAARNNLPPAAGQQVPAGQQGLPRRAAHILAMLCFDTAAALRSCVGAEDTPGSAAELEERRMQLGQLLEQCTAGLLRALEIACHLSADAVNRQQAQPAAPARASGKKQAKAKAAAGSNSMLSFADLSSSLLELSSVFALVWSRCKGIFHNSFAMTLLHSTPRLAFAVLRSKPAALSSASFSSSSSSSKYVPRSQHKGWGVTPVEDGVPHAVAFVQLLACEVGKATRAHYAATAAGGPDTGQPAAAAPGAVKSEEGRGAAQHGSDAQARLAVAVVMYCQELVDLLLFNTSLVAMRLHKQQARRQQEVKDMQRSGRGANQQKEGQQSAVAPGVVPASHVQLLEALGMAHRANYSAETAGSVADAVETACNAVFMVLQAFFTYDDDDEPQSSGTPPAAAAGVPAAAKLALVHVLVQVAALHCSDTAFMLKAVYLVTVAIMWHARSLVPPVQQVAGTACSTGIGSGSGRSAVAQTRRPSQAAQALAQLPSSIAGRIVQSVLQFLGPAVLQAVLHSQAAAADAVVHTFSTTTGAAAAAGELEVKPDVQLDHAGLLHVSLMQHYSQLLGLSCLTACLSDSKALASAWLGSVQASSSTVVLEAALRASLPGFSLPALAFTKGRATRLAGSFGGSRRTSSAAVELWDSDASEAEGEAPAAASDSGSDDDDFGIFPKYFGDLCEVQVRRGGEWVQLGSKKQEKQKPARQASTAASSKTQNAESSRTAAQQQRAGNSGACSSAGAGANGASSAEQPAVNMWLPPKLLSGPGSSSSDRSASLGMPSSILAALSAPGTPKLLAAAVKGQPRQVQRALSSLMVSLLKSHCTLALAAAAAASCGSHISSNSSSSSSSPGCGTVPVSNEGDAGAAWQAAEQAAAVASAAMRVGSAARSAAAAAPAGGSSSSRDAADDPGRMLLVVVAKSLAGAGKALEMATATNGSSSGSSKQLPTSQQRQLLSSLASAVEWMKPRLQAQLPAAGQGEPAAAGQDTSSTSASLQLLAQQAEMLVALRILSAEAGNESQQAVSRANTAAAAAAAESLVAAPLPAVAALLVAFGTAVSCQLPTKAWCNNPGCCNVSHLSEKLLVAGTYCARCRAAAYCSADCQRQHWPQHKGVCKAMCSSKADTQAAT